MRHVPAPRDLALDQWVDSVHGDWREIRCPQCGAPGNWNYAVETLTLRFACGSRADVATEGDDYLVDAYRELVAAVGLEQR
jgi:hypothetical protein